MYTIYIPYPFHRENHFHETRVTLLFCLSEVTRAGGFRPDGRATGSSQNSLKQNIVDVFSRSPGKSIVPIPFTVYNYNQGTSMYPDYNKEFIIL